MQYSCPRCNYNTDVKQRYVVHLKKKKICKPLKADVNLHTEYEKYINCKSKIKKKDMIFKCEHCELVLATFQSLQRHHKTCSKNTNKINISNVQPDSDEKDILAQLVVALNKQISTLKCEKQEEQKKRKELEQQNKLILELTKKAGITNINNGDITNNNLTINGNINIVAYKDTDNYELTDKEILLCMLKNNLCIPALVEKMHFNKKYPHNHNIYVSNFKSGYIMVYDGSQWNLTDEKYVIDDMIDNKHFFLERKVDEWITDKKHTIAIQRFNKYLNAVENDYKLNEIKKEIKLSLYNNKKMVVSHNKQLEN